MREVSVERIAEVVSAACVKANKKLPGDLTGLIYSAGERESSPLAVSVMRDLAANIEAAEEMDLPICQDCGMAVVFAEVGQDAHIVGGDFETAVNEGVGRGYTEGYLRCSVVADPLLRKNTGNNTPAVIHTRIVPGDKIKITVAPKGFGSENMSRIKMFTPSAGREDVIEFILDSVSKAGGNPCPPLVLGVGIGGDFEQCALLSKKALCRSVSERNPVDYYREMEEETLRLVNSLGIGPQGFGGNVTALAVNIEVAPTHIAGLPVAVNFGCHVTRHVTEII